MVALLAGAAATFVFWDIPPGQLTELRALMGTVGLAVAIIAAVRLLWPRRRKTGQDGVEQQPSSPNREKMLERVRHRCIDDGLDRSLKNQTRIALGLTHRPEAVLQRQMKLFQRSGGKPEVLQAGTAISQVFDKVGGRLLILGSPGSGKTTALLELTRDLLTRADHDEERPIPVVFNLSSWSEQPFAEPEQPFAEWLVEELHHSYEVPWGTARSWIDHDGILPLLDGLDEVAPHVRDACVTAINAFLTTREGVKLAVCASTEAYQHLAEPVGLEDSVELSPLEPQQVYDYLERVGLRDVRAALEADESLWELVGSPLMLNIVALAYEGKTAAPLLQAPGELKQRERKLFADYAERMFLRKPLNDRPYDETRAKRWLAWLARTMRKPGEFDLDRLQPTCLPTALQRRLVTIVPAVASAVVGGALVVLAAGLAAGLTAGLTVGLGGLVPMPGAMPGVGLLSGLVFALVAVGGGRTPEPGGRLVRPWLGLGVGLVAWLARGLHFGLMVGLVTVSVWLVYELARGRGINRAHWSGSAVAGVTAGLVTGVVYRSIAGVAVGLVVGLAGGLVFVLVRSDGKDNARETINPVEELRWSGLRAGLPAGLRTGLVGGLVSGLISVLLRLLQGRTNVLWDVVLDYGLGAGLGVAVFVVLVVMVFSGMGSGLAKKTIIPNEGIHRSARRGLVMGLAGWMGVVLASVLVSTLVYALRFAGLPAGLVFGLPVGLVFALRFAGLPAGLVLGLPVGLVFGLANGVVFGLVLGLIFGLAVGLEFGGIACLRHLTLRGLLVWNRVAPVRYLRFLDDMNERLFLSRSGGSYIFRHPLLREYFAGLENPDRAQPELITPR